MPLSFFLTLLPIVFGMGVTSSAEAPGVRRLVVEEQVILRVPVRPPPRRLEWEEKKGPKCIAAQDIRGAFLSGPDHVDFLLNGRKLVRAQLDDDCPALDFYEGFYLSSDDEKICAKRDVLRSRVGASCRIDKFRRLQLKGH